VTRTSKRPMILIMLSKGMITLTQTMDLSPWEKEAAQIASAVSSTSYLFSLALVSLPTVTLLVSPRDLWRVTITMDSDAEALILNPALQQDQNKKLLAMKTTNLSTSPT